mmetsp:Transcript_8845/g.7903  ORF Transcript_8845/g.7903 Transcript_8845/m.7903 type:complete len:160 (+) Transcript_8845:54-533(+)
MLSSNILYKSLNRNFKVINNNLLKFSTNKSGELSYTEKQAKLNRPISPHVTIYKFPIGATTSIVNRFTGMALSAGVTGIAAFTLIGGDSASLMTIIGSSVIGPIAKLAVGFPLVYHYLGGLRHLVWDYIPDTLTNEGVETYSYVLIGASVVISLALLAI